MGRGRGATPHKDLFSTIEPDRQWVGHVADVGGPRPHPRDSCGTGCCPRAACSGPAWREVAVLAQEEHRTPTDVCTPTASVVEARPAPHSPVKLVEIHVSGLQPLEGRRKRPAVGSRQGSAIIRLSWHSVRAGTTERRTLGSASVACKDTARAMEYSGCTRPRAS